jgi:hypothetical protein
MGAIALLISSLIADLSSVSKPISEAPTSLWKQVAAMTRRRGNNMAGIQQVEIFAQSILADNLRWTALSTNVVENHG